MAPAVGMSAAAEVLSVRAITAGYGRRMVLQNLSVDAILPGRITALLGPNGSGKSTLLKALAGIVPLHHGAVALGTQCWTQPAQAARAGRLAYMPQSLPPAVHLRVLESVLAAAHARAGGWTADSHSAMALLRQLGIEALALRHLDELSGGQRQLVALAQALVRQPRVLLLDEPLSALDLNHQVQVLALLRRETEARGLVTLMVLHDINVALRQTDAVLLLRDGALEAAGAPATVLDAATLSRVYGVRVRIDPDRDGRPFAVIIGP